MKGFYSWVKSGILQVFLFIVAAANVSAQRTLTAHPNVNIDAIIQAYYESLPGDYNPALKYPLIIFFHGAGQFGNGTIDQMPGALLTSLPLLISEHSFPDGITVNGEYHEPIVFIPQMTTAAGGETDPDVAALAVNNTIDYALAHFPVDTNRVYLMGISKGGGFVLWGAGASVAKSRRLAGVVTLSAAASVISATAASNMAVGDLPVLSISCVGDTYYHISHDYINAINSNTPPPDTAALLVSLPGGDHDIWNYLPRKAYDYQFLPERGMSIYQWMFSQQRVSEVLPVVLESYEVTPRNGSAGGRTAVVSWKTTHEQNNAFFTIERSPDGSNFTVIAKVPAAIQGRGNTYTYTDQAPLEGTNLYRLSQTDLDGTVKKFDIKSVSFGTGGGGSLKIYPNPVSDHLVLELNNNVTGTLNAKIIGPDGKILLSDVISKPDKFLRKTISISSIPKGFYMLKISGDNYLSTTRFVKD